MPDGKRRMGARRLASDLRWLRTSAKHGDAGHGIATGPSSRKESSLQLSASGDIDFFESRISAWV
jgi:hypothetical protein